jgi:hypothetical protein
MESQRLSGGIAMKRFQTWAALPAIAGLLIAYTTAAHAAVGDVKQTTGGGWITSVAPPPPPPAGDPSALLPLATNNHANFGFVASATVQDDGVTLGDFQGELSYHDHRIDLRLHSTDMTGFEVISNTKFCFKGVADVTIANGIPCSCDFVVTVEDIAEPGKGADTFTISLPGVMVDGAPYSQTGLLGGGNIQTRP